MGMRECFNPVGGPLPMVDKRIGNAYQHVERVAQYLGAVTYVAANMEAIVVAAQTLADTAILVSGVAGSLGSTATIPLPDGVTSTNLTSTSVCLVTSTGAIYGQESGAFTANITNGALKLTVSSSAPGALAGSAVRWRITYSPTTS